MLVNFRIFSRVPQNAQQLLKIHKQHRKMNPANVPFYAEDGTKPQQETGPQGTASSESQEFTCWESAKSIFFYEHDTHPVHRTAFACSLGMFPEASLSVLAGPTLSALSWEAALTRKER